jgi:triosephosphate isomerase (TIM)
MRRRLIAGNWKMHGGPDAPAILDAIAAAHPDPAAEVVICPPATLIARLAGRGVAIGGQDCHPEPQGAHTGDISAEMLREAGAVAVILGHSERRADHGETDGLVAAKALAAWRAELLSIICVGETEADREAGRTLAVVADQLAGSIPEGATPARLVLAYEPVWAIGTGRTPSLEEIAEVHRLIRRTLAEHYGADVAEGIRLLYGGSVKPANAADIFGVPDVDGALVGGASLVPADFAEIITAAN